MKNDFFYDFPTTGNNGKKIFIIKKKLCRNVGWATTQLYCKERVLYCNTYSVLQVGKAC